MSGFSCQQSRNLNYYLGATTFNGQPTYFSADQSVYVWAYHLSSQWIWMFGPSGNFGTSSGYAVGYCNPSSMCSVWNSIEFDESCGSSGFVYASASALLLPGKPILPIHVYYYLPTLSGPDELVQTRASR